MKNLRTPLKGKPFSSLSDEKLKQYKGLFQEFIYCYRFEDKAKEALMQEVWKQLSDEDVDRWGSREYPTEPTVTKPKTGLKRLPKVKRIK